MVKTLIITLIGVLLVASLSGFLFGLLPTRQSVVEVVPFSVEFKSSIKLVDLYEITMSDGTTCLLANRPDMVTIEC